MTNRPENNNTVNNRDNRNHDINRMYNTYNATHDRRLERERLERERSLANRPIPYPYSILGDPNPNSYPNSLSNPRSISELFGIPSFYSN